MLGQPRVGLGGAGWQGGFGQNARNSLTGLKRVTWRVPVTFLEFEAKLFAELRVSSFQEDHMKKTFLTRMLVAVSLMVFGTVAFAQHPGGGGRPAGVGGGGGAMGPPADAGASSMGRSSAPGSGNAGSGNAGSQSPNSVLNNNARLNTSLTNALTKSGISVPGGNLQSACSGFTNLGLCIASLHVANNLNIPGGFTALKGKMTGTKSVSLGKAIEQLNPQVNAASEIKKAKKQANQDIQASGSAS